MSKSFHRNAGVNFHILHVASAVAMIVLSVFLTMHYFEAKYPEGLGSSSGLCNYSSFISCDITTFSAISNIFGVPHSHLWPSHGLMAVDRLFLQIR